MTVKLSRYAYLRGEMHGDTHRMKRQGLTPISFKVVETLVLGKHAKVGGDIHLARTLHTLRELVGGIELPRPFTAISSLIIRLDIEQEVD